MPSFSCAGGISTNSCGGSQICQNGCAGDGTCNPGPTLTGCISANSNTCSPAQKSVRVKKQSTVSLYWNVLNVTSCSITGTNGQSWLNQSVTGSVTTAAINSLVTFTLSCDSGAFTDKATVNTLPIYKEI